MTVYEQLLKIKSEKEAKRIFPTYAMLSEIEGDMKEIRPQLSKLNKEGKIRIGETINSHFIELLSE